MTQSSSLSPEKIRLVDYIIPSFVISSDEGYVVTEAPGFNYKLDFDLQFNDKEKLIRADLQIEITAEHEGSKASGRVGVIFLFQVENYSELITPGNNDKPVKVNGKLSIAIASITYSTARGILLTKLERTPFSDFVLPVIDPYILLNKSGNKKE